MLPPTPARCKRRRATAYFFTHFLRPAARAPSWFIERRNRDVTERQAHESQLVRVQPGETPGSPVAALPAPIEMSASKRRKTVSERRRATDRSGASREACSLSKPSPGEAPRPGNLRLMPGWTITTRAWSTLDVRDHPLLRAAVRHAEELHLS